MRHQNRVKKIGRNASHRKATLQALANALIEHKRIRTTLAKAKALRIFVEPIITKSKNDSTHSRRLVFSRLRDKQTTRELFTEVAPKVMDRPGGYTRILKLGQRQGDAAEMALIELVDFNEYITPDESKKSSSRRRRKKKKTTEAAAETQAKKQVDETTEKAKPKVEAKVEAPAEEKVEAPTEEKTEAPEAKEEQPKEEKAEEPKAEADEPTAEEKADEAAEETDEKKED